MRLIPGLLRASNLLSENSFEDVRISWQNDVTRGRPGSGRFTVLSDCWKRFQNDRIVFLRTPTSFFFKCYGP